MDDKLNSLKIEIRSILLPFQKGCYLSDFNHAYLELIGRRLPFQEMGFKTDIEFLYSMPDVVQITPYGRNSYHLMGIADDKSKHIQKMVLKQKPSKSTRYPTRISRISRSSRLPPRFQNSSYRYDASWSEGRTVNPSLKSQVYPKETGNPPATLRKEEPKISKEESKPSTKNMSPMEEVIELVLHLKNNLALDDLLCEYKRMYQKNLSLSTYGFSSIEECVNEIPELEIVQTNNVKFVRHCSEKQAVSTNSEEDIVYECVDSWEIPPPSDANSSYNLEQSCNNAIIPTSLKDKLLKVAEGCTDGILASDFLRYFEEVTGRTLELTALGYRCLNDFIDDLPDIFIRTPVVGSKKDFLIYSAKNFKPGQKETALEEAPLKRIVLNLREILVAYPEGIKLDELPNVYNINCRHSFNVQDFGFDDLEKFLSSFKSDVPIRFGSMDGAKSIHLVKCADVPNGLQYVAPEIYDKEAIPYDAVFPEFKFMPHTFPEDFDFSVFIPAYTSSVANAGHLYLQFQEDTECTSDLAKLGTDLDDFYNNGNQSEQYIMKTIHIEVGASCIAKWPADNHWYRAQVLSIPSMQNVRVLYVDYGTTDIIPKFLLRYAKREFVDLPIQAVRCRLAFLRPPNNASKWDIQTRNRILKLCQNVPLMAKIEEVGPNNIYSVLLCDTNGDDDVYINDVLINEGLAESDAEPTEHKMHTDLPPLHPLQALQAQYFLQAFAAVAPMFAQNELYLRLLKEVTALCQNSDPSSQNNNVPFVPPVGPPGFNTLPMGINSFTNSNALYNTLPSATPIGTNSIRKLKTNVISPPKDFYSASADKQPLTLQSSPEKFLEENKDIENEIFDDDDDEMFQQFIQKVSLTNVRHVKRVMLGDGYRIHIIVKDSQPYASSGEISQLIWNNKEADYLLCRLQSKDINIPVETLSEDGHEQLFQQLSKYNVKGIQKTNGFRSSIVLYPLKYVMKILNVFGHPSVTLRTKLIEEISKFNPNDTYWTENIENCVDFAESDSEDLSGIVFSSATDDDKIEKLCLYDLYAMKESIVCRKKKMLSNSDLSKSTHDIDKLERLLPKVLNRIQEIQEICKIFS